MSRPPPLLPQVFISHTGQDEEGRNFAANILQPALEAAGISTFIDFEDLQPGCDWPAALVKAAASSAVFVAVITRTYPNRFWCIRELDLALHGHKDHPRSAQPCIIPVYIDSHTRIVPPSTEQIVEQVQKGIQKLSQAPSFSCGSWLSLLQECCDQQVSASAQGELQQVEGSIDALRCAEIQDLQQVLQHPQRLAENLRALPNFKQSIRRQRQSSPDEQQQQQQAPGGAPATGAQPPKNEELCLARDVVAAVLPLLPVDAYVSEKGLMGYEEQLAKLTVQLAVNDPDTLGLWLHGPGGLGKSALAKLLFNGMSRSGRFAKSASIELDLDGTSDEGLRGHLTDLLHQFKREPRGGKSQLLQQLPNCVRQEKVLLWVDNVNTAAQLEALLPTTFSKGSRIIVTSREEGLPGCDTYLALEDSLRHHRVQGLGDDPSRVILRRHHQVPEATLEALGLLETEDTLLKACSGLPLALQVIGGALRCKQDMAAELWQEVAAFCKGAWQPNTPSEERLQDVVFYSFKQLSEAAKNMFLDCVSVLQKQPRSKAMLAWKAWWPAGCSEGSAVRAFKRLQQLAFVTLEGERENLVVLDVIRSLGQSILLSRSHSFGDNFRGSRIWLGADGKPRGAEKAKPPVAVHLPVCSPFCLEGYDLSQLRIYIGHNMPPAVLHAEQLHWAQAVFTQVVSTPDPIIRCPKCYAAWPDCDNDPDYSRHIDYEDCCCHVRDMSDAGVLEDTKPLSSLVILDVIGCQCRCHDPEHCGWLHSGWELLGQLLRPAAAKAADNVLPALQLAALDARILIPEQSDQGDTSLLGQLPIQQAVDALAAVISQSHSLAQLTVFSPGVSYLPEPLSKLTALECLAIAGGGGRLSLPESLVGMSALQRLDLAGCTGLSGLPSSLGGLIKLQSLNLADCISISSLPESLGKLASLQQLNLAGCSGLVGLPESFVDLTALEDLSLADCSGLLTLPASFGALVKLQCVDLTGCSKLVSLPATFSDLVALHECFLIGCSGLVSLPDLHKLADLRGFDLSSCSSLASLPESVSKLAALQCLLMDGCSALTSLPASFGQLTALQQLGLDDCRSLAALPDSLGSLSSLRYLTTTGCVGLTCLPDSLGSLSSLRILHLGGCVGLTCLPESLGDMIALQLLELCGCVGLTTLPQSVTGLQSHVVLGIRDCTGLVSLPAALAGLKDLCYVRASGCSGLSDLPDALAARGIVKL